MLGFEQISLQLGLGRNDIALGRQLGTGHRFSQSIGDAFRLILGHLRAIAQLARQLQGIERDRTHDTPHQQRHPIFRQYTLRRTL